MLRCDRGALHLHEPPHRVGLCSGEHIADDSDLTQGGHEAQLLKTLENAVANDPVLPDHRLQIVAAQEPLRAVLLSARTGNEPSVLRLRAGAK